MGIADLPDVNDEDFYAYTADTFSKRVSPLRDSASFMAMTAGATDPIYNLRDAASTLPPEEDPDPVPILPEPIPVTTGMPPPPPSPFGSGLFGNQTSPTQTSPFQTPPAQPFDGNISFEDDEGEMPNYRVTTPTPDGMTQAPTDLAGLMGGIKDTVGGALSNFWQGDSNKPNIFSHFGQTVGEEAQRMRESGATQSPLGAIQAGATQGVADIANILGGSTEALRQGNVPGALGGTLQATVGEGLGAITGAIAKEAHAPTQILPFIDPETPVIGGLNNPQELANLLPSLLIPETALERAVGKGIGKVAGPALSAVGERLGVRGAERGAEQAARDIPDAVDALARTGEYTPRMTDDFVRPTGADPEEPIAALARVGEGKAAMGIDPRLVNVLGGNLYSGDLGKIAVKEMIQNAIDATRPIMHNLADQYGGLQNIPPDRMPTIRAYINSKARVVQVVDSGVGMTPDQLTKEFLDIGGSAKPEGASGGFGIAKVAILANAEDLVVQSRQVDEAGNWVVSTLRGSGADWADPNKGLDFETHTYTPEEVARLIEEGAPRKVTTGNRGLESTPFDDPAQADPFYNLINFDREGDPIPNDGLPYDQRRAIIEGYVMGKPSGDFTTNQHLWLQDAWLRVQNDDTLDDVDRLVRGVLANGEESALDVASRNLFGGPAIRPLNYDQGEMLSGPILHDEPGTTVHVKLRDDVTFDNWSANGWLDKFVQTQNTGMNVEAYGEYGKVGQRYVEGNPDLPMDDPMRYGGYQGVTGHLIDRYGEPTTISLPGAQGDLYLGKGTTNASNINVRVLNNGMYQFDSTVWLGRQLAVPDEVILDVKALGAPDTPGYPFRPDREGFRAEADQAVGEYIKRELAGAAIRKENETLRNALRSAVPMGGDVRGPRGGYAVMDTSGELPAEVVQDIAASPLNQQLVDILGNAFHDMSLRIDRLFRATLPEPTQAGAQFWGIGLGKGFLAMNIRTSDVFGAGSRNRVVVNPFQLLEEVFAPVATGDLNVLDATELYANQLAADLVHELTHQMSWGHDETFSSWLTRNNGALSREVYETGQVIFNYLKQNPEYLDELRNTQSILSQSWSSGENLLAKIGVSSGAEQGLGGGGAADFALGGAGRGGRLPDIPAGVADEGAVRALPLEPGEAGGAGRAGSEFGDLGRALPDYGGGAGDEPLAALRESGAPDAAGGGRQSPRGRRGEIPAGFTPEQWEGLTRNQRRAAWVAQDAGRTYRPRRAKDIQARVPEDMQPTADAMEAPAEPAGDVLQRVVAGMSPAAVEDVRRQAGLFGRRAPWMKSVVEQTTSGDVPTGASRYEKILELASGERTTGDDLAKQMTLADEAEDGYTPPTAPPRLNARGRERLGGLNALSELPEEQQRLAEAARDAEAKNLMEAHGYRSEEESRAAAERIMPFILQFARGAKPNEPVSEALLRAGRDAWAQVHLPASFAEIDYWKTMNDPDASAEAKEIASQSRDYWSAMRQVLSRYAGETAPSETARGFRSLQDKPRGLGDIVGGGSDEAAEEAASGAGATNRARKSPKEKMYEDMLAHIRKARKGQEATEDTADRGISASAARVAGKRPGSDLDALGLEWADVMRREENDDWNRVKILAGLQDIGGYRMRRDWLDRAMKLNLDDPDAVKAFWQEARAKNGLDETGLPLVRFNPQIEGQSYLGAADTITKKQALSMVSKELITDAREAVRQARVARAEGRPAGEIKELEGRAQAAYERMGLSIEDWPEDSFPILERAGESVRKQIEREWPADRPKGGGGRMEEVEKKRQLLGLFDQAIRKEQKLAGVPVTGIQDALSFGTSNVLMTPRFVQASLLESAMSMINEPFQNVLKGNYAQAGEQVRGMARAFGLPSSDDLAALGEGIKAPALVNAMKGLKDIGPMQSAEEMRQVAKKGANLIKSDSPHPIAKLISPMHRVSRGMSEAFQTGNYFAEVNRLAHEASRTGKLPGGGTIEKVIDGDTGNLRYPTPKELFGNLPQDIVDAALRKAKTVTEGGEIGAVEKRLGEMKGLLNKPNASGWERSQGIMANLMFPFVYGLRPAIQSGMGVLTSPVKHGSQVARALAKGDTEGAKYAAKKFALANSFNAYIAWQVMSGNITGHGPSDPAIRQQLMEGTDDNGDPIWRPDSIRLPAPDGGHFWVKYSSMPGPISMVSTVMGNMYDAYAFDGKDMETTPETAARMAQQVLPAVIDNTYFRDFVNLSEAMNANGGVNKSLSAIGQVAGRFVPGAGLLRLGATLTDPYQRVTDNPIEDIQSGIPGLRQQLPEQISAFTGKPVENRLNPLTALGGIAGNIYGAPSEPNRAAGEIAELNRRPLAMPQDWETTRAVGAPSPRSFTRGEQARGTEFAGQRQTGEAIRGAQQEFGREANRELLNLITSPQYSALSPEQKAQRIQQAVDASRTAGTYGAEGRVALSPERTLERRMMQQPQFYGVTGTPDQVARMNQQIKTARNALAQLSERYGRGMAMSLMGQQAPDALRLAIAYPPVNRDQLWMLEQQEQQRLGVLPEAEDMGTYIPDFGEGTAGGTTVTAPTGLPNRRTLPPGLRRLMG